MTNKTGISLVGFFILVGMLSPSMACDSDNALSLEKVWSLEIEAVSFKDTSVEVAAKHVLEEFRAAYPEEEGLKGIILANPSNCAPVTGFSKKSAVGGVFLWLGIANCEIGEREGIVTLDGRGSDGVVGIPLSPKMKSVLGLNGGITEENIRAGLTRLGLREVLIWQIEYFQPPGCLILRGRPNEIGLLKSA